MPTLPSSNNQILTSEEWHNKYLSEIMNRMIQDIEKPNVKLEDIVNEYTRQSIIIKQNAKLWDHIYIHSSVRLYNIKRKLEMENEFRDINEKLKKPRLS